MPAAGLIPAGIGGSNTMRGLCSLGCPRSNYAFFLDTLGFSYGGFRRGRPPQPPLRLSLYFPVKWLANCPWPGKFQSSPLLMKIFLATPNSANPGLVRWFAYPDLAAMFFYALPSSMFNLKVCKRVETLICLVPPEARRLRKGQGLDF